MKRYNKKRKREGGVELNLAAMLDMAFQLLTFFILTFRPAPIEGEIRMRMPEAMPLTQNRTPGQAAGSNEKNLDPLAQLTTLRITVLSKPDGSVRQVAVGDSQMGNVAALERKLHEVFSERANAFDQVVVEAGSNLSYESLMRVVDVCSRQKLPGGKKLQALSFVEASE